jgi:hypothetical protein
MMYVGKATLLGFVIAEPRFYPIRWAGRDPGCAAPPGSGNMRARPGASSRPGDHGSDAESMLISNLLVSSAILLAVAPAVAEATPTLQTNHSCYMVGTPVRITGSGFAASQPYEVAVDGVDFGLSTTDGSGGFSATLRPGGLGANVVQHVDILRASDGHAASYARFTLTRATGARILAGTGAPATLRAPFQVWGFALGGGKPAPYDIARSRQSVYVHYVNPRGHLKSTILLGATGGQCGYLRTPSRRVFPFVPGRGTWTLQLDTNAAYSSHPSGPTARIPVSVS